MSLRFRLETDQADLPGRRYDLYESWAQGIARHAAELGDFQTKAAQCDYVILCNGRRTAFVPPSGKDRPLFVVTARDSLRDGHPFPWAPTLEIKTYNVPEALEVTIKTSREEAEHRTLPELIALLDRFRQQLLMPEDVEEHLLVAARLADKLGAVLAERDQLRVMYLEQGLELEQAEARIEALEHQLAALKAAPDDPDGKPWLKGSSTIVAALLATIATLGGAHIASNAVHYNTDSQAVVSLESKLLDKAPQGAAINDDPHGVVMEAHDLAVKLSHACESGG